MKRKNVVALLLVVAMAISAVTGCGSSKTETQPSVESNGTVASSETEEKEDEPVVEETPSEEAEFFDPKSITDGVKLTIAIKEDFQVEDYNTNLLTQAIEADLGVDLEFITYPAADYESKLNVMVMSGEELPDIIFNPGNQYSSWAAEEAIIPLNEYYENPDMSANFWSANEAMGGELYNLMKQSDGSVYYSPSMQESSAGMVWNKLWLYEPWLEAIGKDVPQTTEEFYEVCKLLSEQDLNGNGKKDEVMLSGCSFTAGAGHSQAWFDYLMSAFVYSHGKNRLIVEDGNLNFAHTTDEWKEGLKYIKKFFDEGLIPKETLTQDSSQFEALWIGEEQVLFSFAFWHLGGTDLERKANYTHVAALEGPNGQKNACYTPGPPSAGAVISADCENPDAAFLVCDYMLNEATSITNRYGTQGVHWDYWEEATVEDASQYAAPFPGYDIYFIAYDDVEFFSSKTPQNACYFWKGPGLIGGYALNAMAKSTATTTRDEELSLEFEDRKNAAILDCLENIPEEVVSYLPTTTEEQEATADITASLKTYLETTICEFLVGEKDIDADWDAYLAELEKIGCSELLATYQAAYDRIQ